MENASALSTRRDMFLDERGTGLRVTWHPERDLVVLSVWQDDHCVGTFRMSVQDVPRLSGLLAAALGDWVDQAAEGPGSDVPGSGAAGSGPGPGLPGAGPTDEPGPTGGSGSAGDPVVVGLDPVGRAEREGPGLSIRRRVRLSRPVLKLRSVRRRRTS